MGYVGRGLNQTGGQYRKIDDISSGFDGSETSFTLKVSGVDITPTAQNVLISINGVIQEPGSAYSMNGSTITFTGAPDGAASFFGVVMGEASYIAFDTVGANEMGVTEGHVSASRGVVVDSSKNVTGFNQVTSTTFSGIFSGALSSSAQIATDISGSITESSASFSTRVTNTESSASQLNQDLKTSASPTFTGGTYTSDLGVSGSLTVGGTIVAQEFKTEFVSASITFTSGSTIFGDTSDDTHLVTGSMNISGSLTLNDGDLTVTDNVDFNGDLDVNGTTNLDVVDIDGSVDMASKLVVAGQITGSSTTLLGGNVSISSQGNGLSLSRSGYDTYAFQHSTGNGMAIFNVSDDRNEMHFKGDGVVGIGTATPLAKLHVEHTTDDTDENGNIALTVGGGASGAVRHYWGINNSSNYAYYGAVEHATQYVPLVLQPNGSLVSIGSPTHNTRVGQQLALTAGGGSNRGGIAINTYLADTQSPLIDFNRSRSNTVGSHTSVNSGDGIGALIWRGSDGDEFVDTAALAVEVDGSPGNNDMPGRMLFYTTPDGTNSLVERMRINNAGHVAIGGDVVNRGGMNKVLEVHGTNDVEVSITATGELSDDQRIGQFAFYTDKSQYNMACIIGRVSGTDENRGELTFHTRYTESGGTPTERWRMKSTGTFEPGTNNAVNLGASDKRVSVIYTSNSVNVSDRTLKENITASDLGLTFIDTLQPKSFNMKDLTEAHDDYGRRHHGLIAQDLLNTPLSGSVFGDKDGEYSLAYNDLIGPMIKAIQELSTEVQSLKAQVSGSN